MKGKYITARRGQTWDQVCYENWADGTEMLFYIVLEANPLYKDYLAFEGGEQIFVPDTSEIPVVVVDQPYGQSVTLSIIQPPWD